MAALTGLANIYKSLRRVRRIFCHNDVPTTYLSSHHRKRIHRLPITNSLSCVSLLNMLLACSSSFVTVGKVGNMVKVSLPHLQKHQTLSILVNYNVLVGSNHLEFLSLCLLLEYLPAEVTKVPAVGCRNMGKYMESISFILLHSFKLRTTI